MFLAKLAHPLCQKRYPPSTSQWPVPQHQLPAPLRKRVDPRAALLAGACGRSSTCRSQNRRTAFQGKQDGGEHQHLQVLELAFSYSLGITAPGEQASAWITHNCCRGKDLIHILTFLMGSCALIHLVKLSHEHHFLQHLGFPLEVSGAAECSGALCPPSGCETCC